MLCSTIVYDIDGEFLFLANQEFDSIPKAALGQLLFVDSAIL